MTEQKLREALKLHEEILSVEKVLRRYDQNDLMCEDVPAWIIRELYTQICEIKDKKQKEFTEL